MSLGHRSLSWCVWENKAGMGKRVHNEEEEQGDCCVFWIGNKVHFWQQGLCYVCMCEVCVAWKEWVMLCHQAAQSDNGSEKYCVTACQALWRCVFIYLWWVRLCNCLHWGSLLLKWADFPLSCKRSVDWETCTVEDCFPINLCILINKRPAKRNRLKCLTALILHLNVQLPFC